MKGDARRAIPSVDSLLRELADVDLPRPAVVALVRRELAELRKTKGDAKGTPILSSLRATLKGLQRSRIQPVINGTGILVHTNLGRSPLSAVVIDTLREIGSGYSNLEYDLITGERGGRAKYLEHNLAVLCGAQAATVVNNCAAALVLILRHFTAARRNEVVISRGELVQIGGGFRIPQILEASGAVLREVGTTNKTSLSDYSRAVGKQTAMILKVHRSNFFMGGFVESPPTEAIAQLAKKKRVPLAEDLGSGAVFCTEEAPGVEHEPTPAEVLEHGVDLVCFSGDKLFGGPQSGIIAGASKRVAALKREPFFRALRCDKLILSALETTVDLHLRGQVVPLQQMLGASESELRSRAERIAAAIMGAKIRATVGAGKAQVGGGALPQSVIPSLTVDLTIEGMSPAEICDRLRRAKPPVIGYVSGGRVKLDVRSIFPDQDEQVIAAVRAVAGGGGSSSERVVDAGPAGEDAVAEGGDGRDRGDRDQAGD